MFDNIPIEEFFSDPVLACYDNGANEIPELTEADKQRFWSKIDICGPAECWNWTASTRNGYGQFRLQGKRYRAHRIAYFLEHGPTDLYVCHRCDNPLCCNPAHLFPARSKGNNLDMARKGRGKKVLTQDDVLKIIALNNVEGIGYVRIAKRLDLPKWAVRSVLRGKNWSWLTGRDLGTPIASPDITPEIVREIRRLRAKNLTYKAIAIETGVHYRTVASICQGKTWSHVE